MAILFSNEFNIPEEDLRDLMKSLPGPVTTDLRSRG